MKDYNYQMQGDAVQITEVGSLNKPQILTGANILAGIENVKSERKLYADNDAYNAQLLKYYGALSFYNAQKVSR